MATREIEEWSTTDASNAFTPEEGGWPENMMRSDVNNAARADMGAARRWYDDAEWLNLTVNASLTVITTTRLDVLGQDDTQYFTPGRRVKITGGTPSPVYATVVSSDSPGSNTHVTLTEFVGHTGVPATPTLMELHITPSITSSVFLDDIFLRVTTLTSTAIQEAINDLEATGDGGIIVLEPGATYICDSQINIGHGASEGKIRIMGRGAILQADGGVDGEPMIEIEDTIGVKIDVNVILENIIFDGNESELSAASDGIPIVQVGINVNNVWIRSCGFNNSWAMGIAVVTGTQEVWVTNCIFTDMGSSGIDIIDTNEDVEAIFIRGCSFNGINLKGLVSQAGIFIRSKGHISDCSFLNMDHGSNLEVGIRCGAPAQEVTITGCRFTGTGLNARGVFLQGRDITVSSCVFNLTGAGTEGVQIERSAAEALRNIVTGCNFVDCNHAIRLEASSEDCIINGNIIEGSPFPITDAGMRNKIVNNILLNGTDGITLSSTASETTVANNTIETMTSDAITVDSATDAQLLDNMTTAITGSHVNDSGTRTGIRGGVAYDLSFTNATGFSMNSISSGVEELVSDGAGNDFLATIAAWADGDRVWIVNLSIMVAKWGNTDTTQVETVFRLRHGTNSGTPGSDTEICKIGVAQETTGVGGITDGEYLSVVFPAVEFTPASGDDVYMTIEMDNSARDIDILGTDTTDTAYFSVRPK